jgi:hypothetical protein
MARRRTHKQLDKWYESLYFSRVLIILGKHAIDDWYSLSLKEKVKIYEQEYAKEEPKK